MIVNLQTVLIPARRKNTCVLSVNIYNLETIQATLEAASAYHVPIILAFGESYLHHANLSQISSLIKLSSYAKSSEVVIHLDHAKDFGVISRALESGFTSIMYDGSRLPLRENIKNTKEVVSLARGYGASVEAELGYLNNEDGTQEVFNDDIFTSVQDAITFAHETEVDALAIAIGNAHGIYKGIPNLNLRRLAEISRHVEIPLVLHGASGVSGDQIRQAIDLGVAKINVNTEIALSGASAIKDLLAKEQNVRMEQLMLVSKAAMRETVERYLDYIRH